MHKCGILVDAVGGDVGNCGLLMFLLASKPFFKDTTAFALTSRVSVTSNRSLSGTQSFLNRALAFLTLAQNHVETVEESWSCLLSTAHVFPPFICFTVLHFTIDAGPKTPNYWHVVAWISPNLGVRVSKSSHKWMLNDCNSSWTRTIWCSAEANWWPRRGSAGSNTISRTATRTTPKPPGCRSGDAEMTYQFHRPNFWPINSTQTRP